MIQDDSIMTQNDSIMTQQCRAAVAGQQSGVAAVAGQQGGAGQQWQGSGVAEWQGSSGRAAGRSGRAAVAVTAL